MEKELRIQKIQEIISDEKNAYMTGIRLRYEGEMKIFNAYKIPLSYLIYNKYNGRIGSVVKSFEAQNHSLNPEEDKDCKIIEKFLWESKEDRNKKTKDSLINNGQQQWGIVTADGVIIDGNRRASLLNNIYNKRDEIKYNVDHCAYFIAIVLPNNATKKEIIKLETTYQMGQDEKLDYNPIEKYLKCRDLKEEGFSKDEIACMMSEKESEIENMLDILELMEEYLEKYEYDGIYTMLDKREGQFKDLASYINKYINRKTNIDWAYEDTDISDLKEICFDYIRAQYEGKEFRMIGNTSKDSIFSDENVWETFKQNHFNNIDNVSDNEKTVKEIRDNNPGEDLSIVLKNRDYHWKEEVEQNLKSNLEDSYEDIKNIKKANEPIKLISKAFSILEKINTDIESFYTDEDVLNSLEKTIKLIELYKSKINSKRSSNG